MANARTLGQKAGQAVAYHHRPHQGLAYFGGKEGLFLAATKPKLDLDAVLAGGIDGFARRLADQMVDGWEQGDGDPLLALRRSASSRPAALEALGEFLEHEATAPLARADRMGLHRGRGQRPRQRDPVGPAWHPDHSPDARDGRGRRRHCR